MALIPNWFIDLWVTESVQLYIIIDSVYTSVVKQTFYL